MDATVTRLDAAKVRELRRRRAAGESLAALAAEVGMNWQRLWGILRASQPRQTAVETSAPNGAAESAGIELARLDRRGVPKSQTSAIWGPRPGRGSRSCLSAGGDPRGPLVERYRPRRLEQIWGQEPVVRYLRRFAANPYSAAFLFEGTTGTGKTSAALALAAELGCDVDASPPEFGGVHTIASGEQTAETVRELTNRMWQRPLSGSGWKVIIVNEADRMARPVEMIWLDRLEALPPRTVVVFTTNSSARLSQRFKDRCIRLEFECDAEVLAPAARELARAIWRAETGREPAAATLEGILQQAEVAGELSFRRLVQAVDLALSELEDA